jgi:hypothetical protein
MAASPRSSKNDRRRAIVVRNAPRRDLRNRDAIDGRRRASCANSGCRGDGSANWFMPGSYLACERLAVDG